jgi:hypothetical protein
MGYKEILVKEILGIITHSNATWSNEELAEKIADRVTEIITDVKD